MLFTQRDIAFLKLTCWCKTLPKNIDKMFNEIYSAAGIDLLEYMGLISFSRDGQYIRPKIQAYHLLKEAGFDCKPEAKPQTKASTLLRRSIASQIVLTFFRAGIPVFNDQFSNTLDYPVYIPAFAARTATPNNPFGSSKFYGIFCTPQEAYLVFYIDSKGAHFQKELSLFHNLIEVTGIQRLGIIYMGMSSYDIGSQVLVSPQKIEAKYKTDSFSQIYGITTLPVHFVPIGDAGAQELAFMKLAGYRETTAKAILKAKYKPPYEGMPDTDTIHYTEPYQPAVVALDMDVKRIDRALERGKMKGHQQIAIYALPEQIPFLQERYWKTGKAELMEIKIQTLNIKEIALYRPPEHPFVINEGGFFSVENLKRGGKT